MLTVAALATLLPAAALAALPVELAVALDEDAEPVGGLDALLVPAPALAAGALAASPAVEPGEGEELAVADTAIGAPLAPAPALVADASAALPTVALEEGEELPAVVAALGAPLAPAPALVAVALAALPTAPAVALDGTEELANLDCNRTNTGFVVKSFCRVRVNGAAFESTEFTVRLIVPGSVNTAFSIGI